MMEYLHTIKEDRMSFTLPDLPYERHALEPFISEETLEYHHGKHHAGYVKKLNALIEGTEFESMSLEEIIRQSEGAVFNNAAQTFNHNFYWLSLSPEPTHPSEALHRAIDERFGSYEKFLEAFTESAVAIFGSGWCWLVVDGEGGLQIRATSNAHTPLEQSEIPLLTCDVWEHAYYIDVRNERGRYVQNFWKLANWELASKIFEDREYLRSCGALPS